jgi:uncharacterized protein
MEFAWDPSKSKQNKAKHGISFFEAVEIWQGVHMTIKEIARTSGGEIRNATIGISQGKLFTAIWTKRSHIRLISVRRSRDGEKKIYWKKCI